MEDYLGPRARAFLMRGFMSHEAFAKTNQVVTDLCTVHAGIMKMRRIPGIAFSASIDIPASMRLGVEGIYSSRLDELINIAARVDIPKWNTSLKLDNKGTLTASYFHCLGDSKKTILVGEVSKNMEKTNYAIGIEQHLARGNISAKVDSRGKFGVQVSF